MKQHITVAQLNELSKKSRGRLEKFLEGKQDSWGVLETKFIKDKVYPLLSIGQMIEFLLEKHGGLFSTAIGEIGVKPDGFYISLPEIPAESPTGKVGGGELVVGWHRGRSWKGGDIVGVSDRGEFCDILWEAVKGVLK